MTQILKVFFGLIFWNIDLKNLNNLEKVLEWASIVYFLEHRLEKFEKLGGIFGSVRN